MLRNLLKLLLIQSLLSSAGARDFICADAGRAAPAEASELRKYAPERQVDILHLALDVTPDFQKKSVSGKATIRFKPIQSSLSELRLNAEELRVKEVTLGGKIAQHQSSEKWLWLGRRREIQFWWSVPADARAHM